MVTGIVLRTDNGTQYTSKMFKGGVKALGFKQEYIEKNTPEDNGDIESFHNSIKTDYIWTDEFRTGSVPIVDDEVVKEPHYVKAPDEPEQQPITWGKWR